MLKGLKVDVCAANKMLINSNLVILTWGNVSQYYESEKMVVIKPSGVPYDELTPEKMVAVDLDGKVLEGKLKPSSDTITHIEIYKNFPEIKSIVHTHSTWATIWCQMGVDIPVLGTTHADDFGGRIPCTRGLTELEVNTDYEKNTGKVIVDKMNLIDKKMYAILVKNHGPFVFGKTPIDAVNKAIVLEQVAKMAWYTCCNGFTSASEIPEYLIQKHFERKHGNNSYYGQKK